jgi:hypothetical protein
LYEDAKRRTDENKRKKEELDKVRDLPKEEKFVNKNQDKFVIKKFDKEFKMVIESIPERY